MVRFFDYLGTGLYIIAAAALTSIILIIFAMMSRLAPFGFDVPTQVPVLVFTAVVAAFAIAIFLDYVTNVISEEEEV
jgi:hypothetical protein